MNDSFYVIRFECEKCEEFKNHVYIDPDDFEYYCDCGRFYKKEYKVLQSCRVKSRKEIFFKDLFTGL